MLNKNNNHQDIVLIVEDTPANHDVIRTFLNDMEISCESAFDGLEAVTRCSSVAGDHYSLILMDLNLPHMDGFRTAKSLRQLGVTAPIISITATDKNDPRLSGARDIFNGVLFKPFNASEFFSAVMPHMQRTVYCSPSYAMQPDAPDAPLSKNAREASEGSGFSISEGIENLGNNRKLFIKHFNSFKANNADLVLRLTDMLRQGDVEQASFLCHSIKGLSGMLGMNSLQHHIAELEEKLKSCMSSDSTVPAHILTQLAVISNDLRHICQIYVD